MAVSTVYAELDELKGMLRITDTADDDALQNALTRASRAIDKRCSRRFYSDGVASARTYRCAGRIAREADDDVLIVDDISTAAGLILESGDGTTWTEVSGYFTEPDNAIARGEPITGLRLGRGYWGGAGRIQVTADWGWPAVPESIVEATLLLANRRFKRRDSPEGVAGWATDGPVRVSRFDPDIEDLVTPYVLVGFG